MPDAVTRREALLAAGALLAGCSTPGSSSGTRSVLPRPPERPIAAAFSTRLDRSIPRTVLDCPAGECILVHFPPRTYESSAKMDDVLEADPASDRDDGTVYRDPAGFWTSPDPGRLSQFNCCAFAVGDLVELTPTDWLCGDANELTDGTIPMEVMLESYFSVIADFEPPYSSVAIRAFAGDTRVRDGDVVCFIGSRGPDYCHAGRVRKRRGDNWVLGKFGEDPILWTPIQSIAQAYEGLFDQVRVYRFKPVGQGRVVGRVTPAADAPRILTDGRRLGFA